jgi:hypothetical protein
MTVTGAWRALAPFVGDQVVVDGALARVVDQVVDKGHLGAALHQRVAFHVRRVQIAVQEDLFGVVVDQRAF